MGRGNFQWSPGCAIGFDNNPPEKTRLPQPINVSGHEADQFALRDVLTPTPCISRGNMQMFGDPTSRFSDNSADIFRNDRTRRLIGMGLTDFRGGCGQHRITCR